MKITVLGAGAWGTALAIAAAARHDVRLWARNAAQADAMRRDRCNRRYLDAVALPPSLVIDTDRAAALAHAGGADALIVIATPMAALREQLRSLPPAAPALWLCKGFEAGTALLGHEVADAVRPGIPCAVLSGPSFALEVARGQPTALVAAGSDAALTAAVQAAFHGDAMRIYRSDDIVGVETGGAVKNVLAIAAGIVDGLPDAGLNARAALLTRGLAEMARLGVALGARADTFMGLSGLGDLVLTGTGALSRNRQLGLRLAAGEAPADALAALGHVAEGVPTAPMVLARARAAGVEMPISAAVVDVLDGRIDARRALARLMARAAGTEHDAAADAQTPPA